MRIVFHCLGMPFNGETIKQKSLGGSETACYYQCLELARRGHDVSVFTNIQQELEGEVDGVKYFSAGNISQQNTLGERFEWYARNTDHDVLIVQRAAHAFHGQFASNVNILQLHDLGLYRTAAIINHGMWNTSVVTAVSLWHKEQLCKVYGIKPEFVKVVRNGVDPELYTLGRQISEKVQKIREANADKFLLLYQSRPERGLENLVGPGGIMRQLVGTNAKLLTCTYDNNVAQMKQFYDKLNQDGIDCGNVENVGNLTKQELADLQQSCDLLVYPTQFEEVSCISAMEAMHAGLPMLTTSTAALPETCHEAGVRWCEGNEEFAQEIKLFSKDANLLKSLKQKQLQAAGFNTWVKAVDQLELVISEALRKRRGTKTAIVRHALEHSDIGFAISVRDSQFADPSPLINEIDYAAGREIGDLYNFASSPEAYRQHYEKHQSKYYDEFEEKVVGEDITHSSRFRGVGMFFYKESQRKPGRKLKVMDYGCAHGHYLVPLVKTFNNCEFTGVDVSKRAIAACFKWIQKENISAKLFVGDESILVDQNKLCPINDSGERELFDIIYAGEVIEHVPDFVQLLERFRMLLAKDGVIIATTPTGRWEWSGTVAFRQAREHLSHFDRADIFEVCGDNPVEIAQAPAGNDRTGRPLGSFVWSVRPFKAFNTIDYQKKIHRVYPRQTVSACIIVKDGERFLRRCIESLIDWVDEIVIAIDPSTTDRTEKVIMDAEEDFPHRSITYFEGVKALKEGFAAARNLTVERAVGDWILWIDADEELQQPWNLWKYLKHGHHDAVAFPQIHYSANPPGVLTTDFPCRLFRNNGSIKFYGMVHEHPETEPGKAIPHALISHEVQFLHSGYVDEEVRRNRFIRNLPLLHRDMEVNPTRSLNRFLFLRDIAQGMMFEQEQSRGFVLENHVESAMRGIKLWEEILEKDPLRLVIDSLKYYSHLNAVLGRGFEAKVSYRVVPDGCPTLAANMEIEGRFYSCEHFSKLLTKVQKESTQHYESKYF